MESKENKDHKGMPITYWGGKSEQNKDHIPEVNGWKGTHKKVRISRGGRMIYNDLSFDCIADFVCSELVLTTEKQKLNAELFADALNIIQKCNLMPSELLEENQKLKVQIESYKQCFESFIDTEKWDEATLFLDASVSGLSKAIVNKEFKHLK